MHARHSNRSVGGFAGRLRRGHPHGALAGLLGLTVLVALSGPLTGQAPGSVLGHQKIFEGAPGFTVDLFDDDWWGSAVAGIGDIDGDGIPDAVAGMPNRGCHGDPTNECGAFVLLKLNADGTVKESIESNINGLQDGDHFGRGLAAIGDLDGDGFTDLAVGAHAEHLSGDAGAIRILFPGPGGTIGASQLIDPDQGGSPLFGLVDPGDQFGVEIATLGDLDGDGVEDIVCSADHDDDGAADSGALWVLFLETDGSVKSFQKISATSGGFGGDITGDRFGSGLDVIGDLDDDGVVDLIVGAQYSDGTSVREGSAWVLFLNSDGTVKHEQKIDNLDGGFTGGLTSFDWFGICTAGAGDIDGDGTEDVFVGAVENDAGCGQPTEFGSLWLLFLNADGTVKDHLRVTDGQAGLALGVSACDDFPSAIHALGDLDGDGFPSFIVGARWDDDGGSSGEDSNTGAVYVLEFSVPATFNDPYDGAVGALRGRAGRTTVVSAPGGANGGDIEIPVPIVPVPVADSNQLELIQVVVETGDDAVSFPPLTMVDVGEQPAVAGSSQVNTSDADDADDLVVINKAGGTLGSGSFSYLDAEVDPDPQEPPYLPHAETDLVGVTDPVTLAIADFNDADDHDDVLVGGAGGLNLFLGNGNGTFIPPTGAVAVDFLTDMAYGDLDGDGDHDVVTVSGQQAVLPGPVEDGFATVFENDGFGGLTAANTFADGVGTTAIASILLADFDGDVNGDLDALIVRHVYEDSPGGDPQAVFQLWIGQGDLTFLPGAFSHAVSDPDGSVPTYGAVGDFDADGDLDVIYTTSDNISHPPTEFAAENPALSVFLLDNDGSGGFTVTEQPTAYGGKGVTPIVRDIAPNPLDGRDDAIIVWYADPEVPPGATTPPGAGTESFLAALVNDGAGELVDTSPNQFLTGEEPGDGAIGDANGDSFDGSGGPDIFIPNLAGNSFSVYLTDGLGGIPDPPIVTLDVDDEDGTGLPTGSGQDWLGGPREIQVAHLDGDGILDAVTYNLWEDLDGISAPVASLSLFRGLGGGNYIRTQYIPLPLPGDFALGDVANDADVDVVVTQQSGGSDDELLIYRGLGDGTVDTSVLSESVSGNGRFSGGIALMDITDSSRLDVICAVHDSNSNGRIAVFWAGGGGGNNLDHDVANVGTTWNSIRSLDLGDVNGDGDVDVLLGRDDARLVLCTGDGSTTFAHSPLQAPTALVGGGALRLADFDGDGDLDVVSSTTAVPGTTDQALVRKLRGTGAGQFSVQSAGGLSAVGPQGALRPLVADLNDDETLDTIVVHGTTGALSILLNDLSHFETYNVGTAGTGGIVPSLTGKGYSTPGGAITITIDNAVGGTLALLQAGFGRIDTPPLAVGIVTLEFVVPLSGTFGAPGMGTFSAGFTLPNDASIVGAELTMQAIIADPAIMVASPAVRSFSLTNGLAMLIVD